MNLNSRQQILGIVAIAVVALLAGDRLVFSPLVKAWKTRSESITKTKKLVSQGQVLLDREKVIAARWNNMRSNTLTNELSQAEGQVLKALDRWSQESRIGISSIKPQWKRGNDDHYMTLECRVDGFGALPAMTRFLYDVEKDALALRVESVEITARDDRGEQLTFGLLVSGLLLNPPAIP
jgi:hypothetical protein